MECIGPCAGIGIDKLPSRRSAARYIARGLACRFHLGKAPAVAAGESFDDRARVDGHRLSLERCEEILADLAREPVAARRAVRGLHPDRAPTIVAGGVILVEAIRLFGLGEIEVSEHDILDGAALEAAETARKHA